MNKVEIIKGIDATIAGLETIKNAIMAEGDSVETPVEKKQVAKWEAACLYMVDLLQTLQASNLLAEQSQIPI